MSERITKQMLRDEDGERVRVLGRVLTVGALRDALAAFPPDMPVLVDGYEMGMLHPATPRIVHVENCVADGGGMFGDFEDGKPTDPPMVLLSRHAAPTDPETP